MPRPKRQSILLEEVAFFLFFAFVVVWPIVAVMLFLAGAADNNEAMGLTGGGMLFVWMITLFAIAGDG